MLTSSYFEAFKAITHLSTFTGNATKNWGGGRQKLKFLKF